MRYREIAARQRGFLLRSQLTEEEIQEHEKLGLLLKKIWKLPHYTPSIFSAPSSVSIRTMTVITGCGF